MKSHESVLLEAVINIIIDVMTMCTANESAKRDIKTVMSRVKHEGLSFLTITLPSFGADFERCLALNYVDPTLFRSFKKSGKIPSFLKGIFGQVFDADTGRIYDDPPAKAIRGIRQIAYILKKVKLACNARRVRKAFYGYIMDERVFDEALAPSTTSEFKKLCDLTWGWLSSTRIRSIADILPRHGPGATAERISGNRKYKFRSWHDRLEPYFPLDSFAFVNSNAITDSEELKTVSIVSELDEQPVRVITVPKTLKTPRIIAIEPVCMQYTQQALAGELIKLLNSSRLTAGHLNFNDQSINQKLAIMSSQTGKYATLDLSSASDRVPLSLVKYMFDGVPDFRDAICACRSRNAMLPDGKLVHLRKFASMGSALCFPIESMYFYTLCIGALLEKRNLPVTSRNVYNVSRDVYVYGDDIIVPVDEAVTVISYLQKYYCKVNMSKSFWTGKFRESCGMDAFSGKCVTPIYIREMPPDDRRTASALISWVKTANQLEKAGYNLTSSYLYKRCEQILGDLPSVSDTCAGLGRVPVKPIYSVERWNRRYQHFEVKCWVATPVYREDKLDGYPALLKCLLRLESRSSSEVTSDAKHLSRSARFGAVTLKRRWVRPY